MISIRSTAVLSEAREKSKIGDKVVFASSASSPLRRGSSAFLQPASSLRRASSPLRWGSSPFAPAASINFERNYFTHNLAKLMRSDFYPCRLFVAAILSQTCRGPNSKSTEIDLANAKKGLKLHIKLIGIANSIRSRDSFKIRVKVSKKSIKRFQKGTREKVSKAEKVLRSPKKS